MRLDQEGASIEFADPCVSLIRIGGSQREHLTRAAHHKLALAVAAGGGRGHGGALQGHAAQLTPLMRVDELAARQELKAPLPPHFEPPRLLRQQATVHYGCTGSLLAQPLRDLVYQVQKYQASQQC